MTHRDKLMAYIWPMVRDAVLAMKFPHRQRRVKVKR